MKDFLAIWGGLAAFYAVFVIVNAKGAIHEIEAGVALLIATLAFGLSGVINEVQKLQPPAPTYITYRDDPSEEKEEEEMEEEERQDSERR